MRKVFYCDDKITHFKTESDGRVRLVLMPEDRVIFIGNYNEREKILLLSKGKTCLEKRSYTFAIPAELWENLEIKTVGITTRDSRRIWAITAEKVRFFGYSDQENSTDTHGQRYLFVDVENWTELGTIEEIVDFRSDNIAHNRREYVESKGNGSGPSVVHSGLGR